MKVIHISDLHLGKSLGPSSLEEAQEDILKKIIKISKDENADAIIIAGDVYDVGIPSEKAVALLDRFLTSLMKEGINTLLISGNHDSAQRISFGNKIMEAANIYVSSAYKGDVKKVTFTDEYGPVNFYLLPFFRQGTVKKVYPDEKIENYTDAMRVIVEHMNVDTNERNVLIAHQFITGSEKVGDEISVGTLDNIDASAFEPFDYVALGHIHRPQNVGGDERICYCGTPLKYSLSEVNQEKSVKIVEFKEKKDGKANIIHSRIPLKPLHELREVRGNFDEIINGKIGNDIDKEDFVVIRLTDEEDIPNGYQRLNDRFSNIVGFEYDNKRTNNTNTLDSLQKPDNLTPLERVEEFYRFRNNQDMTSEQLEYMDEIIKDIWQGVER